MEARILAQGKADPPALPDLPQPIIDLSGNQAMTFCVIEAGMQSGEPSVMIISADIEGSIILQTSLDKFMTAASTMAALAETRWGWKRPEGHFSLMPPSKEARQALLEAIRKELEEWED
jgi:hypothetical protein